MDRCDDCGYDYGRTAPAEVGGRIRALAEVIALYLRRGTGDALRRRPAPTTWSRLEYGCHVRDVVIVQRERVLQALREDEPAFAPMGRDERVVHDAYAEQDPALVARMLLDAAALLAALFDRLDGSSWQRAVAYSYPTRATRSLEWVGRHTVHELVHHLRDMARGSDPLGAAVLVWRRGSADEIEVLLLHRVHDGPDFEGDWAWTPPTGGIEPGEDVEACARRELREETGLELDLVPCDTTAWSCFTAEAPADAVVVLDQDHDRFEWVTVEEAVRRCRPETVAVDLQLASLAFTS